MADTSGSTTPAGWYTDPGGSGHLRWWDGAAWSAHLAPQPTDTSAPAAQAATAQTAAVHAPIEQAPVVQASVAQAPAVERTMVDPTSPYGSAIQTADNQPYVPFQGAWNQNNGYGEGSGIDLSAPTQWSTPGAWWLAFSNVFFIVFALLFAFLEGATIAAEPAQTAASYIAYAAVLIQLAVFALQVLFVLMDRRKLRSYGFAKPAAFWWILLTPLVYLIMRGVVIRRRVYKGFGPLIAYLVFTGLIVILSIVASIAIPAFLVSHSSLGLVGATESSSAFTASLQKGLNDKGGNYTVVCPPTIPVNEDAVFSCTATAAGDSTVHTLKIEVVRSTNGTPTAKLVSVTPAITH